MPEDYGLAVPPDLPAAYAEVRATTERLAEPLSPEDQTVQSMPDVSPTKWHRAHTTWFFETFVLSPNLSAYALFDDAFPYIFNSYYEALGDRHPRTQRGILSRPGVDEIGRYREAIDDAMGSLLAAFAPAIVFRIAFVVIVSFIAVKLLFGRDSWRLGDDLPGRPAMTFYGFLVGLCSSLMGVSGGSLSNLVLMLYGKSIHNAVAISAGLGVPISIAGAVGYALAGLRYQALLPPLSVGFVSVVGLVLMAPVSSFVAVYGARLAHALSRRRLEIAFSLFLLAVALRFLVSMV